MEAFLKPVTGSPETLQDKETKNSQRTICHASLVALMHVDTIGVIM